MTRFTRLIVGAALAVGLTASPALADGNVKCGGGPQAKWASLPKLKKQVWMEGWTLAKIQIEGDCYEVYAHTAEGQAVEAFFHPVTLQKLVVFRRGSEIFRAKGFTG